LQLGRYQILKQLATGDVADVHLARATGLEGFARHVVLKAIRPELAHEERLVASFLEEARIAAALHHQNVVQVHDIGEQDGAYFFAMEYVHGEDVRKLIATVRERGELVPIEHVIAIVTATAAGLHHAHEQRSPTGEQLGLVHRDVCPANILLGYDGSVKLVDFGMAKAGLRSTKTATGTLKLKASYMSPEQCCGRPVDRRADIFSLGIVLYELLTARRLFKGANEYLTMAAIVEGEVPPPSRYRPDLARVLDEVVLRALARSPEARYQTAEDLREALERFAIDHELRTSNKSLADYMIAQFGQRPEPWHAEAEPARPPTRLDTGNDLGLVAAPEHVDVIKREAPRLSAPIMLAQTMNAEEVDDGWGDGDEPPTETLTPEPPAMPKDVSPPTPAPPIIPPPTATAPDAPTMTAQPATVASPTEPTLLSVTEPLSATPTTPAPTPHLELPLAPRAVPAPVAAPFVPANEPATTTAPATEPTTTPEPPARTDVDDPDGATLVAPPVFIHEDPTVTPLDTPDTPAASPAVEDDDGETLDRRRANEEAAALTPPPPHDLLGTRQTDEDATTIEGRRSGQMVAAIPPAAALEESGFGRTRRMSEGMYVGPPAPSSNPLLRFVSTHRSVFVSGGAAVVVLLLAVIAMRACG
jgi:serine/threonine protein kinase